MALGRVVYHTESRANRINENKTITYPTFADRSGDPNARAQQLQRRDREQTDQGPRRSRVVRSNVLRARIVEATGLQGVAAIRQRPLRRTSGECQRKPVFFSLFKISRHGVI